MSQPRAVHTDDTIAAVASAPGGAIRGIVRLSGPDCVSCLQRCFEPTESIDLASIRSAHLVEGHLRLPDPLGRVSTDLYLWPTVRSYTRQPAAELHTLGSPPILDAALQTLCRCGARLAEPGEFTLRAFLAGRIDLTQAEAVLGVVDAQTQQELDVALEQLAGGLANPLVRLRGQLLDSLAHLEAGLDFVDEDIEFISPTQLEEQLSQALQGIQQILEQLVHRGQAGDEYRIVLSGWPNVGKSSLLNALAGDDVAIVSEQMGTTRDYVGRCITIEGHGCLLIDTAGFASRADQPGDVAAAAQQMAAGQLGQADLELFCIDATRPLNAWEQQQLSADVARGRIIVQTKMDLATPEVPSVPQAVRISSRTGVGLAGLRTAIGGYLQQAVASPTRVVTATAVRCHESLREAAECLGRARSLAIRQMGDELVAAELRNALDQLATVVGAVYTEDILERIFSRFCIGK